MNPSNNQSVGIPTPVEGQALVSSVSELDPKATSIPATPVASGQMPAAQPLPIVPMTTVPLPRTATNHPQNTTVSQTTGFQVADDKDIIEPEWVQKAKAIVNSTSDDPYKQSEELTVLKADYMQKRYNKIVKLK
jgi:hypothetical protein